MAIGTATAILGSAVIGAGASALSSNAAAKKAANAANYAADQNAAVNREIYQQTRQDLAPYNQAGQAGLTALLQQLGVAPAQVGGQPQAVPVGAAVAAGPQPDFNAYVQSDPGIMAEFNRNMASGKGREYLSSLGISTPADFGRWHYETYGQAEGRNLPMTQPAAPAQPAAPGPAAPTTPQAPSPANPPTDLMTAPRPNAPAAPTFQRPTAQPAPTYSRPDALSAPDLASFFSNFEASPGYQFRLAEGLNAVNTASAARGKLRSGDAAKALQERGEGLAAQEYDNWWRRQAQLADMTVGQYRYGQDRADRTFESDRGFGTDAYRFDLGRNDLNYENDRAYGTDAYRWGVNRSDDIFDADRGYQTNRYDQRVSNLFGLAGIGQNAAAGTASAGNVFAQNQINSNNQRAATTANAAIAGAQNMGNMFGSAAQAVGTYYGLRGRGTF